MNSGSNKKTRNHLKDSFFVEVKDATIPHKYESMWINYEEKQTENVLLAKTPAIAMDIIHLVVIPEDAASSDFGEDYEFSNFTETYSYRLILNQLNLKVNSDSIHRIEKLMSYYNDYMRNDYLPYFEEKPPLTRSQLQVASAEDYDALINEVPTKQIQFHIKDLTIEFYPWVHNKNSKIKKKSSLECKTAEHNRVNLITIKKCPIDKK